MMMKKNVIVFLLLFLPVALLAQVGVLKFKTITHNFETIKEEGGLVTHTFEFENRGRKPIIINSVEASCGCTTPIWTKEPILPMKKGVVKISYNPENRPGKFSKTITVKTNVGKQVLRITGVVTPRPKTLAEIYPKKMGQLRLTTSYAMFNEIGNNKEKTVEIKVVNDSKENINVSFGKTPDYVAITMKNTKLSPREKGVIKVVYDASKTDFWGFHSELIPVLVNGKSRASNKLVVTATVIEDFSKMSKKDKTNAAVLGVDKFESQFDATLAGDKVKTQFKIMNIGKSPLILRRVDTSSDALNVKLSDTIIAPNSQAKLDVIFNTSGKQGYQNQQVTIITNAPDFPVVNFRISGLVE